ncbi:OsmC family protein [Azospirillum sp. sgz302134]
MAGREHHYSATVTWTGNLGTGTSAYKAYSRDHEITAGSKPVIPGSSDPAFRGDPSRYNPEDMLVASLSACHMLWYLHLCATAGIAVTAYSDAATGTMAEGDAGGGRFTEVTLRPQVTLAPGSDTAKAEALHHEAHEKCFIANSVNFPVRCEPKIELEA